MKRGIMKYSAALLALAVIAAGCAEIPIQAQKPAVFPKPFLPIPPARATIVPISQFMRVAVLNFVDQTGVAGQLNETLADILSTELHKTGRFEVYDRGQLRSFDFSQVVDQCQKSGKTCSTFVFDVSKTPPQKVPDRNYNEYDLRTRYAGEMIGNIMANTDAMLVCAITSVAGSKVTFDYRLVNSNSFTTMVSGVGGALFDSGSGLMKVSREDITKVAMSIKEALPTPTAGRMGKITVQDGKVLTVSLGRKDMIIPGMNVFVVVPGRGVYMQADKLVDEMYLAQAYVVSVYDNTSQVVVFQGVDYRVGDDVRFK